MEDKIQTHFIPFKMALCQIMPVVEVLYLSYSGGIF